MCVCVCASEHESRTPFYIHKCIITELVTNKGLVPGSIPGEFSIVCIGTAFPVIPGVPSILADAVFCRMEAETI